MTDDKIIKVELIKSPADFNELLDLQTLQTQMQVLSHLQGNLRKYQLDFVKSFLMKADEVLHYIPQDQHHLFEVVKLYDEYYEQKSFCIKNLRKGKIRYIVLHSKKYVIEAPDFDDYVFTLSKDGNSLEVTKEGIEEFDYKEHYRMISFKQFEREACFTFDLKTNRFMKFYSSSRDTGVNHRKW